ncbi:hypothetical protein HK102_005013 [Quaeritorhiza haematococci]|nr:hypothetical protein HK102_005013 [Quaeritorhiza haematococci]
MEQFGTNEEKMVVLAATESRECEEELDDLDLDKEISFVLDEVMTALMACTSRKRSRADLDDEDEDEDVDDGLDEAIRLALEETESEWHSDQSVTGRPSSILKCTNGWGRRCQHGRKRIRFSEDTKRDDGGREQREYRKITPFNPDGDLWLPDPSSGR